MKEKYRCVSYSAYADNRYNDDRCKKLAGHSGAHKYSGDVEVPKPEVLPQEPEHGWSPYERFQNRKRDITSVYPDAEEYLRD